jgi:hypothetical protein
MSRTQGPPVGQLLYIGQRVRILKVRDVAQAALSYKRDVAHYLFFTYRLLLDYETLWSSYEVTDVSEENIGSLFRV